MKFKLLVLAFLLICLNNSFAQKWQMSVGASLPIGNFASSDINNPHSGLATIGEALEVGYLIKEKKYISFLIKTQAERNPINRDALSRQYDKIYLGNNVIYGSGNGTGGPSFQQEAPVTNWTFENHSWWTASLSAGIQIRTTNKTKQSWYGQGLLGGVYVKSPLISGSAFNDTTQTAYSQSSGSSFGFKYQLKGGIILKSSKELAWDIGIIFSGTNNLRFKKIKSNFFYSHNNGNFNQAYAYQSSYTANANQVISSLQLLIGIRF